LLYFYIDIFKEVCKCKFKKSDNNYLNFSLLFGAMPLFLYFILWKDDEILILWWFYVILILKILFDYRSNFVNFIINSLLLFISLEILYFYNGNFVLYGFIFSWLAVIINNAIYNNAWMGNIIKLCVFTFYYLTSWFSKLFNGVTFKINNLFIFFPIVYFFVILEIYITQWIPLVSNILTNWFLSELWKFAILNQALYIYIIIFFILNFKRIFGFFNRNQLLSLVLFLVSIFFIIRWDNTILIQEPVTFVGNLFFLYFTFVLLYVTYAIYLHFLNPKVINEIDFWFNMRAYAAQLLEKDKDMKFIPFLENCHKNYVNEYYKYYSELNDASIDGISKEDLLNRWHFVSYLNNVVSSISIDIRTKQLEKSYSIWLVWNWWEWKTSIIDMLCKKYLDINSLWINTLHFNPWNYQKEDMVLSFFSEIESTLWYWYAKGFRAYLKALGYLWATWSWLSKFLLWLGSLFYEDNSINTIKKKLNDKLSKRNKVLLIIIDDLDRCTPDEVLLMLNILKNLWDLSSIIYLVSYDKLAIENILIKNWYLVNYLDKVINQELFIPMPLQDKKNEYILAEIKNIINFIIRNYCHKKPDVKEVLMLVLDVNIKSEIALMFKDDNLRIIKKILNLFKYNLIDFLDFLHKQDLIWKKYSYQRKSHHNFEFIISPEKLSYKMIIYLLKGSKASVLDFELYSIIKTRDWVMLADRFGSKIEDVKTKSNFDDYLIENYLKTKLTYDRNWWTVIMNDKIWEMMM